MTLSILHPVKYQVMSHAKKKHFDLWTHNAMHTYTDKHEVHST